MERCVSVEDFGSRANSVNDSRCSGTNRFGRPCGAKAVKDGRCAMHAGLSDAVKMGRAGGLKAPETQIRRALKEDDQVREQAKDVIRRGMAGDPSVTKTMLDAARSVFSFRAAQPPQEQAPPEREHLGGRFGIAATCSGSRSSTGSSRSSSRRKIASGRSSSRRS
jgi:hypothetical protein